MHSPKKPAIPEIAAGSPVSRRSSPTGGSQHHPEGPTAVARPGREQGVATGESGAQGRPPARGEARYRPVLPDRGEDVPRLGPRRGRRAPLLPCRILLGTPACSGATSTGSGRSSVSGGRSAVSARARPRRRSRSATSGCCPSSSKRSALTAPRASSEVQVRGYSPTETAGRSMSRISVSACGGRLSAGPSYVPARSTRCDTPSRHSCSSWGESPGWVARQLGHTNA